MIFTAIKTAIKDYCLLSSTEADTRVGQSINRHYRRITSLLGMDATRFVTRSANMTIGVSTVTFTEIEKIDRIRDTTDATAIRLLQEVGLHELRSTQPGESEPMRWALQNTDADSVVALFDTVPQSAYSLQADGWTTLADLSGSDEPVFPESFHDILVWYVIAEELLKKEKLDLSTRYEQKAAALLSDLRFHLADSPTKDTRQGGSSVFAATGGAGGGAGNTGSTSYTQSGLLTFDRGAGVVPFAVARADAPVVTNLDADKLDGQHGSYYRDASNLNAGTLPLARLVDIANAQIAAAAAIAWTKISKSGSSLADLATRSASELNSGTLPLARLVDITNTEIAAAAAIAWSKISKSGAVLSDIGGTLPASQLPAGSILQVVTATYATQADSSSATFADTGLTASITPASTSNKILAIVFQAGCGKFTSDTELQLRLMNGASVLGNFETTAGETGSTATLFFGACGITYLDAPASVAAQTYKTQFASAAGAGTARVQASSSRSSITLLEVVG